MAAVSRPQGPIEPELRAERPIDPNVRIGHVHLRTADIDRVRDFYVGILGFDVVHEARGVPGVGDEGRHPLCFGRRLSPPPCVQHVEVSRRAAAA
jgi:catechol 2,3-dioxygenase-like lactoylglutathione lyase family enzyme